VSKRANVWVLKGEGTFEREERELKLRTGGRVREGLPHEAYVWEAGREIARVAPQPHCVGSLILLRPQQPRCHSTVYIHASRDKHIPIPQSNTRIL